MKSKTIFTLTFWLIVISSQSQYFQKNYGHNNYCHDVCTAQMQGSITNIIIAGNYFEPNFTNPNMELCSIDQNSGNLAWQYNYIDSQGILSIIRVFDVVAYTDQVGDNMLAVTGSVTTSNTNYAFVAKFDKDGTFVDAAYYVYILPSPAHSQGLSIIYTLNGPEGSGFVVGGFTCIDYDHQTNDAHKGFVMYVKEDNLMPKWTIIINSTNPYDSQYDMVSDVTETISGFFVTGSLGVMRLSTLQQAVLCLGIDFDGGLRWTNSITIGNSRDVGVDAYYDQNSNEVYLLANNSDTHHFSIIDINDGNGIIDYSRSWNAYDGSNIERYGFTVTESLANNPGSLVIGGYIKEGEYTNELGNPIQSQTLPFAYEFDKMNGNQVSANYFYNIPYQDPGFSDYFDFWSNQMPLIYYPNMMLMLRDLIGYFIIGYRAYPLMTDVNAEYIKVDPAFINECYRTSCVISHSALTTGALETQVTQAFPDYIHFILLPVQSGYDYKVSCPDVSISDRKFNYVNVDISPNPAHDRLFFNISSQEPVYYSIYNAKGIKTGEGKLNSGESEIDISMQSPGLYFIKLLINDEYMTRKVIIE